MTVVLHCFPFVSTFRPVTSLFYTTYIIHSLINDVLFQFSNSFISSNMSNPNVSPQLLSLYFLCLISNFNISFLSHPCFTPHISLTVIINVCFFISRLSCPSSIFHYSFLLSFHSADSKFYT